MCVSLLLSLTPHLDQSTISDLDAESVLTAGAKKELAYLDRFGAPRMPYSRFRRESYEYEKQLPSDHAENLRRYLRLAPSLVPDDASLDAFCIRHPDLTDSNIKVSRDYGDLRILSILDWQHAAVFPLFLYAGVPDTFQNWEDESSRNMVEPKLPSNFHELPQEKQGFETDLHRRRLVHYHYSMSTAAHNDIHLNGLAHPLNGFCRRIVNHATAAWEGETIDLLYALIDMVDGWETRNGSAPCPVEFTEDEKAAAATLYKAVAEADDAERQLMGLIGYGEETWVPVAHYADAKALAQEVKRMTLEACAKDDEKTEEGYAAIQANWPLDDVDEEELEESK